jgi:hypothetical protein
MNTAHEHGSFASKIEFDWSRLGGVERLNFAFRSFFKLNCPLASDAKRMSVITSF